MNSTMRVTKSTTLLLFICALICTCCHSATLRGGNGRQQTDEIAFVEKLAAKYNCRDVSGDLATTVASIVAANAGGLDQVLMKCAADKSSIAKVLTQARSDYKFDIPNLNSNAKTVKENLVEAANLAYAEAEKKKQC